MNLSLSKLINVLYAELKKKATRFKNVVGGQNGIAFARIGRKKIDDLKDNTILMIRGLAEKNKWVEDKLQPNPHMIRFKREFGELVDVYPSKMTVGTLVHHPTRGREMLFRRNVDRDMLNDILINPRVHTNRGYFRK